MPAPCWPEFNATRCATAYTRLCNNSGPEVQTALPRPAVQNHAFDFRGKCFERFHLGTSQDTAIQTLVSIPSGPADLPYKAPFVSIHARNRATTPFGRGYTSPERDYPSEGGGFQPELVFDETAEPAEVPNVLFSFPVPRRDRIGVGPETTPSAPRLGLESLQANIV